MQDALLTIRAGVAYTKFTPQSSTSVSAAAAMTDAAYDSTYFLIPSTPAKTPKRGWMLEINYPAAFSFTATGTLTSVSDTWTVTFSDDGTNAAGETITFAVIAAVTTNAASQIKIGANGTAVDLPRSVKVKLADINHKYIRVQKGATAFTGGSAQTSAYGVVGIGLVIDADHNVDLMV